MLAIEVKIKIVNEFELEVEFEFEVDAACARPSVATGCGKLAQSAHRTAAAAASYSVKDTARRTDNAPPSLFLSQHIPSPPALA